jgi:RNA polymerase sigma factor (sigma-70 family)
MAETRETLIMRLRDQRDEDSWKEFDGLYRGYIAAVVRNAGVPSCAIDDVIQDVLLKAWKNLPNFDYDRSRGRFRYWLNTITLNTVRTRFAKEKRLQQALTGDQRAQLERFIGQDSQSEVEKLAEREWKIHVAKLAWTRVVPQLSDKVRMVFEALIDGKDPDQIALEVKIERNTVYVYKRRVEQRLAREVTILSRLME